MRFAQSLIKKLAYRCGYTIKKLQAPPGAKPAGPSSPLSAAALKGALHRVDPYQGFDFGAFEFDPSGWGSGSPAFAKLIEEQGESLQLIIEVGTWKGGSAIEMARVLEEAGSEAKIVCVDTWLGALEFWRDLGDTARYGALELKNGYPSVYYRFLANICHSGHQGRVVPFPQTSAIAALWFAQYGVEAGLVYIDGSHEEGDVYADLVSYWDLLAPGGVLFGDDWNWDGVRMAVERFARENRLTISHLEDKWLLRHAA